MPEVGTYLERMRGLPGCDVIALATHGRGELQRWLLESVTRVLDAPARCATAKGGYGT